MFPRRATILCSALLGALLGLPQPVRSYSLLGYRWPDGSQIVMHLDLNHTPISIKDGTGSWAGSATDALTIWNQYITPKVQFITAPPISDQSGDGANSAFFANSIYGESFPSGVLAVTLRIGTSGSYFTETDVIFNDNLKWASYRGALMGSSSNRTYDFHRVALHEFGHVLGLDHPDAHYQTVQAIMNSTISNLDHLADDDIAGARWLYGPKITSYFQAQTQSGASFSYQITADNHPTSFAVDTLPPGLQLDPVTGVISGHCTSSGWFNITLSAQGDGGVASSTLQLDVIALPLTSSPLSQDILIKDDFSYQITASNSPLSFTATNLPPGLHLDAATGVISGAATTPGTYSVNIHAQGANAEAVGNLTFFIVGPKITSSWSYGLNIGSPFDYQITANNRPTSFEAQQLPASLHFDPASGKISGVPTLSGNFHITLTAHGLAAAGDATLDFLLSVQPLRVPTTQAGFVSINVSGALAADPKRDRIYVLAPGGITVLDSKSFVRITTVTITPFSFGQISVSADGDTLWIVDGNTTRLRRIDLRTLSLLPDLTTSISPYAVRQAADGYLYATLYSYGPVYQLDATSGAVLSSFGPNSPPAYFYSGIELSPDGRTLYVSAGKVFGRYSVAPGSSSPPAFLESVSETYEGTDIAVTPDGNTVLHHTLYSGVYPGIPIILVRDAHNLHQLKGTLSPDSLDNKMAFSSDSKTAIMANHNSPTIDLFDLSSLNKKRKIEMPLGYYPSGDTSPLVVDRTGSYVFIAGLDLGYFNNGVCIYPVMPPPAPPAPSHSLLNVSTRLRTQTGDNVLIGGFIINGSDAKQVLIRATGPSLPVPGQIADPTLELHNPDGSVVTNDNWNEHRADVVASGFAPENEHEAALVATLQPGTYTAILRGVADTSGVALVEVYDLNPNSNSRLTNISTRGKVETNDNVMIAGFIIGGNEPTKVIIRALGPSLANSNVSGVLNDTTLELHDNNGNLIAFNDDWQSDQAQEISDTNKPPPDPREAALLRTLQPGLYTAIVHGKNNATGVGLVEVYNLETN